MTIRAGLRLLLIVLAGVFLASDLWMIRQGQRLDELTHVMSDKLLPAVTLSGAINTLASDLRIAELTHIGTTDVAGMDALEAEMAQIRKKIEDLRDQYARLAMGNDAALKAMAAFMRTYEKYLQVGEEVLNHSRRNEHDKALELEKKNTVIFNEFGKELDVLVGIAQMEAASNSAKASDIYNIGSRLVIVGVALVLAVCGFAMWGLDRRVARPIAEVADAARALAEGRLTEATTSLTGRRDEIGDLARAVDQAAEAVRAAATAVGRAAEGAAAGDLSARADPAAHRGDYAELAHGVNRLIEALSQPLREVADVMRKVAGGGLEGRMVGAYDGDVRALKANLNRSLDTVVGLLTEVGGMANGLAEGRLDIRLTGAYHGAFADIKDNVNDGLDSLRAAMAVIYVNIGQVAAAAVETAAAGNQVAALAADESAARAAVRDVAGLAGEAHLLALNAGVVSAREGEGFAQAAADIAALAEKAEDAARRLQGAGMRGDGADSAAAAAQIGAAMGELARMVEEIKIEIQRFTLT